MHEEADLILHNGVIYTLDENNSVCNAVAVKDCRIVAVGSREEVMNLQSEDTELLDVKGLTVLPGFIDTHVHLMFTGRALLEIDLSQAKTIQDIKDLLRERAEMTPKDDWIFGFSMNDFQLNEKREPYKEELDEVTTDHYVVLYHFSCHCASTNSRAFELLNISPEKEGVDTHDDGTPTGVIRDPAILGLHVRVSEVIGEERRLQALKVASRNALSRGITTIHALEDGELAPGDAEFLIKHLNETKLRIVIFPQIMDVKRVQELGLPRIGGCILADGALENHTAALFEPYSDTLDNYGALYYATSEMEDFIMEAHKAGMQIAIHAIGERAIEQVLTAYEKALAAYPKDDHRHRIEHFDLPTWYQIDRAAKSGVVLSMNPGLIFYSYGPDMKMMTGRLGATRVERFQPYKQIVNAGILVVGGSDAPCSPLDPLAGICYVVCHPLKENRSCIMDAVKMFTIDAARAAFEENEKGSIEVGKLADMIVLDRNPFRVAPEEILNITVLKTILGGKIVYSIESSDDINID